MDLQDYIRVIRKQWPIIALATLLALLAAGALSYFTPRTYQAESEMFVSTTAGDSTADLASGTTFMSKQIKTYADIMTSPKVLNPVRKDLGIPADQPLASSISATVPPETVLIDVAVVDRDPEHAARVANSIAHEFTTTVDSLQSVEEGKASPVKVTVVRPATVPTTPVAPRPLRNMALGLLGGLLLGLGLALLRDRLDTRVKGESDVKAVTDDTIIGGIAYDDQASAKPLIVKTDPYSPRAEAFRSVRTNLQFVDAASHPRSMVLTSSLPGEGKTTTTANLALAMADAGSTVCLVEADLRRPKLLSYMGLESGVGLTTVLIGEADLDDVLQPYGERVTVLGCGQIPPNPSELLGSPAMKKVLDELTSRFDYVVVDAPPLLPVTDAAVLSRQVDGMVLVVGMGLIKREHLARSLESLDAVGARVLGLVLNRTPSKGVDSYYYGQGYAPEGTSSHKHSKDKLRRAAEPLDPAGATAGQPSTAITEGSSESIMAADAR